MDRCFIPPYAESADAVLPLLEKQNYYSVVRNDGAHIPENERVWCTVFNVATKLEFEGYGPTFCTAACRALCLAHGVDQQEIDAATP
jgi:hypothetical protein